MTVARIWRARIDVAQAATYEAFAADVSTPMFRRQPGFEGVAMMRRRGDQCLVLTLWEDAFAAAALARSASYVETVAAILETGFVVEEQGVELLNLHRLDPPKEADSA